MQDDIAEIFKNASGRVIASLYAQIQDFELIEDAVQDAFVIAITQWQETSIPENPSAWISVVARRKALDKIRRNQTYVRKLEKLHDLSVMTYTDDEFSLNPITDERLKLMFMCCHPALAKEAQVALTLRTFGGLSTEDIAKAFLVPVPTMAQRLVRAKRKIRDAGIPFRIPEPKSIASRVDAILAVMYLIYNAGYTAHTGNQLMRQDVSAEAIRLTRLLYNLLHREKIDFAIPEVMGLLALMLLNDSRAPARIDAQGNLIPLEEQNRMLWHQDKIREGQQLLEQALQMKQTGVYQLQAIISALHAEATHSEDTDWEQISVVYSLLEQMMPSPVVQLNRIVAVAMTKGAEQGLALLDKLENDSKLAHYYLFHATCADLHRRLHNWQRAITYYQQAIEFCTNDAERRYLNNRLAEMQTYLSP